MADNLNKIKKILAGLSNLTTENGASEEEALSAAIKMSEMLDRHGLTMEDIEDYKHLGATAGGQKVDHMVVDMGKIGPIKFTCRAIAALFSCQIIRMTRNHRSALVFVGFDEDRICALELMRTIQTAMEADYKKYRLTLTDVSSHGTTIRTSFMNAYACRVALRITEIVEERKRNRQELIICKNELIAGKLAEMGMKVKMKKSLISVNDPKAAAAGDAAGSLTDIGITRKVA